MDPVNRDVEDTRNARQLLLKLQTQKQLTQRRAEIKGFTGSQNAGPEGYSKKETSKTCFGTSEIKNKRVEKV